MTGREAPATMVQAVPEAPIQFGFGPIRHTPRILAELLRRIILQTRHGPIKQYRTRCSGCPRGVRSVHGKPTEQTGQQPWQGGTDPKDVAAEST